MKQQWWSKKVSVTVLCVLATACGCSDMSSISGGDLGSEADFKPPVVQQLPDTGEQVVNDDVDNESDTAGTDVDGIDADSWGVSWQEWTIEGSIDQRISVASLMGPDAEGMYFDFTFSLLFERADRTAITGRGEYSYSVDGTMHMDSQEMVDRLAAEMLGGDVNGLFGNLIDVSMEGHGESEVIIDEESGLTDTLWPELRPVSPQWNSTIIDSQGTTVRLPAGSIMMFAPISMQWVEQGSVSTLGIDVSVDEIKDVEIYIIVYPADAQRLTAGVTGSNLSDVTVSVPVSIYANLGPGGSMDIWLQGNGTMTGAVLFDELLE